mmetsp:Transcript_21146/g.23497  ORF Transcript_21146/g.23497 Transcript_21146/m.23497 type:complete len:129 (+) Transcript_21146:70-456(+)
MIDLILRKETLFWLSFGIDVLLCLIQFPMFLWNGPQWMMDIFHVEGGKDEKNKPKVTPAFCQLYDLFLVCYSGYCAMMFYSCYSIIVHPDLLPKFGSIMLGVIFAKSHLCLNGKNDWDPRRKTMIKIH